ncbi:MAG: ABC-three component system protein [Clostridium sp.]
MENKVRNKEENKRKKYTPDERLMLLFEVDEMCPLCWEKLIKKKGKRTINLFEIAHIYPHSPSEYEVELLKDEERLSDDVDDIENVIMLCPTCHTKHDKYTTVEEYRNLLNIKKQMTIERKCRELYGNYTIDEEINSVVNLLAQSCSESNTTKVELLMSAMRIDEKADDSLELITKITIENYVRIFFPQIKNKFIELDNDDEGIFESITLQIKIFYLQLKKINKNQTVIFEQIVEWIHQRTGRKSRIASTIIASFFVQNCEVFS